MPGGAFSAHATIPSDLVDGDRQVDPGAGQEDGIGLEADPALGEIRYEGDTSRRVLLSEPRTVAKGQSPALSLVYVHGCAP